MKAFRIFLAVWLLAVSTLPLRADIVHQDAPGLTLYARIRTSSTTSVTAVLTEGTSNGVGYYVAADSLIDDVLTTAGTYPFKVFSGSPSASADHPLRGVGTLNWSGVVERAPDARMAAEATVWHVDGTSGSDSNDGRTVATAKATINAARTLANPGDKILIQPATYVENVTINKAGITLEGVDRQNCIINPASGIGIANARSNVTIRGLTIISDVADGSGYTSTGRHGVTIDNCTIDGDFDGVYMVTGNNCRILNSLILGRYDAANFSQSRNLYCENTTFASTADYSGADTVFRAIHSTGASDDPTVETSSGRMVGCQFIVTRTTSGSNAISAVEVCGNWSFLGCGFHTKSTHASHSANVYGLRETFATPKAYRVELEGCTFSTSTAGAGTAYDVHNAISTSQAELVSCAYTTTKTSGNVAEGALRSTATNAVRRADVSSGGEVGLDWANVGSPTTSQTLSGTTVGTASAVGAGGITAASFAADAITAAKVATDAVAEIWAASAATPSAGSFGEAVVEGGSGGSSDPVSPDIISPTRTWIANGRRAQNIVEVTAGFVGTFALKPDLNTSTTINAVTAVSITGAATVTATDLEVDRSRLQAHFTVPALSTVGTYTVVVTVTTVDGQTIKTTGTLKVY